MQRPAEQSTRDELAERIAEPGGQRHRRRGDGTGRPAAAAGGPRARRHRAGGPDPQDGQPPGTVFFGIADDAGVRTEHLRLDRRDPAEVCADTAVEALAMLLAQLRSDAACRHSDPARAQRGPA